MPKQHKYCWFNVELKYYSLFLRITVKIDDEMVKHYCNEDLFILEVKRDSHSDEEELYEVTLIELPSP